jgi:glycosyltransferase involved in cell wall biosynthesis
MLKLSVVVPTYNEEKNIRAFMENVKDLADEIIVVDMFSEDKTTDIARQYTDKIYQHNEQRNLNINNNLGISHASGEWILNIDADERLTPELKKEIRDVIIRQPIENGFLLYYDTFFLGKFLKYGPWLGGGKRVLFRKGTAQYPCKIVHETIHIQGASGVLQNHVLHYCNPTISSFFTKMNLYTSQYAEAFRGTPIKINSLPRCWGFLAKRFARYYIRMQGYREGWHGLIAALCMVVYDVVQAIKIWEKQQ